MLRHPVTRIVLAILLVAGTMRVASGWLGMVTTRGVSMEPTFVQGDLVLIKRTGSYKVGDIIAYHSVELGEEVLLHRVIDVKGDRYVTQGDNNDFVDADRPTDADVVGVAWWHIPRAGTYMSAIRRLGPMVLGPLAALAFAMALKKRRPQHDRRPGTPVRTRGRPVSTASHPSRLAESATPGHLAVAAVAFAALALLAFTKPVETKTSTSSGVMHRALFDYSAPVSPSLVYPDGSIDVGDPIFRSAAGGLSVGVDYDLDGAESARGAVRLEVAVRVGEWDHVVHRGDPVPIDDGDGRATTRIDFAAIDGVIAEYAKVAGQKAPAAMVAVTAAVEIDGQIGGNGFADEFAAELELALNPTDVRIDPDQLEQAEGADLKLEQYTPAEMSALGQSMRVSSVRSLGILGAVVFGFVAAWRAHAARPGSGRRALRPPPRDPRMIHVTRLRAADNVVEVPDLDTLRRVADDYDRLVLCARDDLGRQCYAVDDGATLYRTPAAWVP